MEGFKPFAWRDWVPPEKKSPPPKVRTLSRRNGGWTTPTTAKFTAVPPPNSEDIEYVPCRGADSALQAKARVYRLVQPVQSPRYIYAPERKTA